MTALHKVPKKQQMAVQLARHTDSMVESMFAYPCEAAADCTLFANGNLVTPFRGPHDDYFVGRVGHAQAWEITESARRHGGITKSGYGAAISRDERGHGAAILGAASCSLSRARMHRKQAFEAFEAGPCAGTCRLLILTMVLYYLRDSDIVTRTRQTPPFLRRFGRVTWTPRLEALMSDIVTRI